MRTWVEECLLKAWMRRGVLTVLLWPLSLLYRLISNFRFALYVMGYKKQTKLPVPVVMVGNVFVGGTGKTPLVIRLVERLRAAGWTPGVISRGYGADPLAVLEVRGDSLASEVGDEPLLIFQRLGCPTVVGRRRALAGQHLLAVHPEVDVIISDDGLQHYALARDVEIILFDQRGVGNGCLFPAGPLRESARRRRDFTILNAPGDVHPRGIGEPVVRMQLRTEGVVSLTHPDRKLKFSDLQGKRILAAAGIGNPARFFDLLSRHGVQFERLPLPDHFTFQAEFFAQKDAEIILITEKDAVKCRQLAGLKDDQRVWVVPVSAHFDTRNKLGAKAEGSASFEAELLAMIAEKKNGCKVA